MICSHTSPFNNNMLTSKSISWVLDPFPPLKGRFSKASIIMKILSEWCIANLGAKNRKRFDLLIKDLQVKQKELLLIKIAKARVRGDFCMVLEELSSHVIDFSSINPSFVQMAASNVVYNTIVKATDPNTNILCHLLHQLYVFHAEFDFVSSSPSNNYFPSAQHV